MMTEATPLTAKDRPTMKAVPSETSNPRREETSFHIARLPVRGQTGWSIVPW